MLEHTVVSLSKRSEYNYKFAITPSAYILPEAPPVIMATFPWNLPLAAVAGRFASVSGFSSAKDAIQISL